VFDTSTFDGMWSAIEQIGRDAGTGGYRRFAWTRQDAILREWFAGEASARGLDLVTDRAGNQWAWWGDPEAAATAGRPGVVIGSHLDSVPDGGAFDGPLGVVSALAVIDALKARGFAPSRPIGVANFVDEEGARFGIACAGSRLITGKLDADKARGLRDADGVTMAEAMAAAGHPVERVGPDSETLRRIGTFVELHVEQGRGLIDLGRAVAVGSSIWPHGRWRIDLDGEANHAGTTRLEDRDHGAGRPGRRRCSRVRCHRGQGSGGTQWCQRDSVESHGLAGRPGPGRTWGPGGGVGRGVAVRRCCRGGVLDP